MMSTTNKRILRALIVIGLLFMSLALYLTWFELEGKKDLMTSTYNKRHQVDEAGVLRGQILDRNQTVLAYSDLQNDVQVRHYPYKGLYAHVIGYNSDTYGKTLLEVAYNDVLLGKDLRGVVGKTERLITGELPVGNNLILTLDHQLQEKARTLLGKSKGAVVALDPKTGQVLAMVSSPDFDANAVQLEAQWPDLIASQDSPFLARAYMGLYPPGSTFKIITGVSALENDLGDLTYDDEGSIVIDGKTFTNYKNMAHGQQDMSQAMTVSSNVYFTQIAQLLGAKNLISTSEKAGFGSKIPFDLAVTKSRMGMPDMSQTELAATAIGQGKLMTTPLQMALVASGIANDGLIQEPYLVHQITDIDKRILSTTQPQKYATFTDPFTANHIKAMMVNVVKQGTGKAAQIKGLTVAGKTGTAQTEKSSQGEGFDHAWFIGFAPAEDPQIAIAVVLEYQGQGGGEAAAPIARKIMSDWLNR